MASLPEYLFMVLRHGVTAMIAVFATVVIGKTTDAFKPAEIVTVDPAEALVLFVQGVGIDQGEQEYAAQVHLFHDRLIKVIRDYSAQTGTIVLNASVVLDGVPDVTRDLVALALSQPMNLATSREVR